jgi:hypothetical protein
MANTDFYSFLVDETLKLQQSGEAELSSLELKLKDYKLQFLKGEFIPQSQMLRFEAPFGVMDIPINWSIFSLDWNTFQDVVLTANDDKDHFLEVMKATWNSEFSKMLVTHSEGFCYLVGLKAHDEVHLHDLLTPQEWLKTA